VRQALHAIDETSAAVGPVSKFADLLVLAD